MTKDTFYLSWRYKTLNKASKQRVQAVMRSPTYLLLIETFPSTDDDNNFCLQNIRKQAVNGISRRPA